MEDGEKLGIVKFAGTATALKQMTEITDVTRKELIGVLPIKATGTTSIGSGECIAVSNRMLQNLS